MSARRRPLVERRGRPPVADRLMAKDALGAHARDELGISEVTTGRPVQAALTSAWTFAVGAALPLSMLLLMPRPALVAGLSIASFVFLGLLGTIVRGPAGRMWARPPCASASGGALAMALTAGIGAIFGTVV